MPPAPIISHLIRAALTWGNIFTAPAPICQGRQRPGQPRARVEQHLRRCEGCHTMENTHNWLPYKEAHTTAMSCESCHIPEVSAPALEMVDWTAIQTHGEPLLSYRGVDGERWIRPTI
jgi:hypothetical protein